MLKNKNILLISKETYSFPFYFLAKELLKSNSVASYFFNPPESFYNQCLFNKNTYYKHKEIDGLKIFDNNDILEIFSKNLIQPSVDWEYLENIEKKCTVDKGLMQQIITSQCFSRTFHERYFLKYTTYEQQMYWLELNYKKVDQIFIEFKPDYIFDLDTGEITRSVLSEVAIFKNIPYITIGFPRYESYKIPSYSVNWKNNYFQKLYNEKLKSYVNINLFSEEFLYIEEFNNKKKIMADEHQNTITAKYNRDSIIKILKRLIGVFIYFFNLDIVSRNYTKRKKNKIFFSSSIIFFWYYVEMEFKKWFLMGHTKYFKLPKSDEKYIYMPLHLIPESSTFVQAPYYINELFIIEQISKSLPVGWFLYVKEHQAMLGERKLKFYKQVNKLPNVKMVKLNYYNDPKPWIINSIGVITIIGTSAYEAALLGKKSIIFGDVPFSLIDGVTRVRSFEDLPKTISEFGNINNRLSCAAYLATVKEIGVKLDLNYLMDEGEKILNNNIDISQKFTDQIYKLKLFYIKSIKALDLN